jgi:two-component system LytT family response regulator
MKVVIVDDETLARALLREYLAGEADVEIVAECANGFEAVKAITELAPDLVFLDIQMPKLDGFEVAELVGGGVVGSGPRLVFCTAFDQYALKAFEVHALDYLLKPFSRARFVQALEHARAILAGGAISSEAPVKALLRDEAQRRLPLSRVLIRDGAAVQVVASDQIDYIEAQDDYVRIAAAGKSHLKNQTLSELEAQLDAAKFLRIHRSYLLNVDRLASIEQATRDSHVAVLRDGSRLPVSKSGYQKLRTLSR